MIHILATGTSRGIGAAIMSALDRPGVRIAGHGTASGIAADLSDPAAERLSNCGLTEVVLTNTLPIPQNHRFPKLTVLSIAPILARAIHEVFEDGSVTSLFES